MPRYGGFLQVYGKRLARSRKLGWLRRRSLRLRHQARRNRHSCSQLWDQRAGPNDPAIYYDDPEDMQRWLAQLRHPVAWHWRDSAAFSSATSNTWNKRPALLRTLEILPRHAHADGSSEPWLAFRKLLRWMDITSSCLRCLVLVGRCLRMPVREPMVLAAVSSRPDPDGRSWATAADRNGGDRLQ